MKLHRFGRKISLHATLAIKHQILRLMLDDELRAVSAGCLFEPTSSPALALIKKNRPGGMG